MIVTERDVKKTLRGTDFYVDTYSPSDGVTHYRFFLKEEGKTNLDYFAGYGMWTAIGAREAHTYAAGLAAGFFQGTLRGSEHA